MKKMSIPVKLILSLIVGMISITLLSVEWFPITWLPAVGSLTPTTLPVDAVTPTSQPTLAPTPTSTVAEPFTNLADLLLVEMEFYASAQPQVLSQTPLEEGRLTPDGVGDTRLLVVDPQGKTVYEISFTPVFVYGEPSKKHETIRMTFILPNVAEGGKIVISSTDWTMEYPIHGN